MSLKTAVKKGTELDKLCAKQHDRVRHNGLSVLRRMSFTLEVKSLNHRYLDMKVRSPERFYWAEERIREVVKENLSRG